MKWVLLTFVAMILVIGIVLAGGLSFILDKKTDLKNPAVASKFQTIMEEACLQEGRKRLAPSGGSLDYQQEALVKQFCGCWMKEITKILAKKGGNTPAEIQKTYLESRPEVEAAFGSCAAAYGLQ